jgi:hypothetical protein
LGFFSFFFVTLTHIFVTKLLLSGRKTTFILRRKGGGVSAKIKILFLRLESSEGD